MEEMDANEEVSDEDSLITQGVLELVITDLMDKEKCRNRGHIHRFAFISISNILELGLC